MDGVIKNYRHTGVVKGTKRPLLSAKNVVFRGVSRDRVGEWLIFYLLPKSLPERILSASS